MRGIRNYGEFHERFSIKRNIFLTEYLGWKKLGSEQKTLVRRRTTVLEEDSLLIIEEVHTGSGHTIVQAVIQSESTDNTTAKVSATDFTDLPEKLKPFALLDISGNLFLSDVRPRGIQD